jgi:hypothetical protein
LEPHFTCFHLIFLGSKSSLSCGLANAEEQ